MHTQLKAISQPVSFAIFVALLLSLTAPSFASAAKPEVAGQEKAATVGNKTDSEEDTEDTSSEEDATSEDEDSSKKNTKVNSGEYKVTGLERAASVVNRDEIRAKLATMMELIALLQQRLNEMKGIGSVVKDLKDVTDDSGDDTGTTTTAAAVLLSVEESLLLNDEATDTDNAGQYTFEIELTAWYGDVEVGSVVSAEDATTTDILVSILDSTDAVVASGTVTGVLTSSASSTGDSFVVLEGDTETFTVTVTYDPEVEGSYRAVVNRFTTSAGDIDLTPVADYQSDLIIVTN